MSETEGAGRGDASELGPVATAALFATAFIVSTCGLVYELVAAAMGSYLLGDSVTQFSLVIGLYLSAMGLGSWLSKFVGGDLVARFVRIEVAVGVVGGLSALLLLLAQAYLGAVRPVLYSLVVVVGTLVGLEIPLLLRVLKDRLAFAELVARVLAFDYLGALAASLCFPLLLVPLLGLPRTALVIGILNATVGLLLTKLLSDRLGRRVTALRLEAGLALILLVGAFAAAEQVELVAERVIYDAPVLVHRKTRYQTLVVTRWRDDTRLWIDGHLQFSSKDEHRYHEALVHPGAAAVKGPLKTALVLGGGDGLAVRELLRYPDLRVTLVDLDPGMTGMFSDDPTLAALNGGSLRDPRVTVINADAMTWLEETTDAYDLAIVDMPDPRSFALGKLYTREFYRLVRRHVAETGAMVVQSSSPYAAPRSFACITATIADAEWTVAPYHCHVPSFGDWGFVLAVPAARGVDVASLAPRVDGLRFLTAEVMKSLFVMPPDRPSPEKVEINRLSDQSLVRYHEEDWQGAD